jgi:hypothetical protein
MQGVIMAYRISTSELGITGEEAVFQADTPGEIWEKVSEYLRRTRGIKLPDMGEVQGGAVGNAGIVPPRFDNAIVAGQQGPVIAAGTDASTGAGESSGVNLIMTRLIEKLNMGQTGPGGETLPPGGGQSLMP